MIRESPYMTVAMAVVILASAFIILRGLRGWLAGQRPALWLPFVVAGGAGVLFATAYMLESEPLMFLASVGIAAPAIWRLRHPA